MGGKERDKDGGGSREDKDGSRQGWLKRMAKDKYGSKTRMVRAQNGVL